jgi:site-specific DNA-methyltransferase (adenine-specific)
MNILHLGDCLKVLREMQDCSIDSIVTDPPYGLSFMGKRWDYDVPSVEVWAECLRVLKPGGHLLAFAGTRTQHRMACRIEDAGFEIRDMIAWVYGSGFPKSLDVSKAIDKAAGEIRPRVAGGQGGANTILGARKCGEAISGEAISGEAQQWAGWGTALKPALEPITMARKPFTGTVVANVLEHGTGAINVDGCRVNADGEDFNNVKGRPLMKINNCRTDNESLNGAAQQEALRKLKELGRWPANLIHDGSDEVVELFPQTISGALNAGHKRGEGVSSWSGGGGIIQRDYGNDSGSAARFFYCAKTSKRERGENNNHPTVKPIALMAYLCRLVTPANGIILDPFMGSGSTGIAATNEGYSFVGIEQDPEYFAIAQNRINATPQTNTLQPPLPIAFD